MIVLRTQLAGVARRPVRLLLTGLSVLIAAFVVFGAVLTHTIMVQTTLDNFSETPAGTDVVLEFQRAAHPPTVDTLAAVRKVPGVAEAAGRWENSFAINGSEDLLGI